MNNTSSVVVAILAAVGTIATASAQDINWDNAAGGFWNDTANWNPMEVPNVPGETAIIGLPGTYAALIRGLSLNIDGLFITNPNATVGLEGGRDIILSGPSVVVDGTLVINDTSTVGAARLLPNSPVVMFDGSGEIVMNDNSLAAVGRAQIIDASGGISTFFGPDLTVRGSGQFNTNATVNGLLQADAPGLELAVIGTPKTNNGVFRVDNGGVMRLQTLVIQGPGGRIEVPDGRLNLRNTIAGGEIDSTGGTFEIATGNGIFDNIERITGDVELENSRDLQVRGGLTLDGTLTINRESGTSASRLLMATSGTIDGDATIVMNDRSPTAQGRAQFIDASGGLTVTLADTVLVRGSGQINSNLINDGTIRADQAGLEMAFIGTPKTNNNLIEINDGGVVRLQTTINQGPAGRIIVNDGRLNLRNTIVGGEIDSTGGTFEIASGNGVFDNIERITGDVELENGRDLQVADGLTIDGTIIVNRNGGTSASRLLTTNSSMFDGNGELFLNGSATSTTPGRAQLIRAAGGIQNTFGPDFSITGNGQVNGDFTVQGTISPGRLGSPVGETGILTSFIVLEMEDSTRVVVQIGGSEEGEFDHINGSANIVVDGTLEASIIDGFEAGVCENFVIISGTSVTGEFDTFIPPVATSNRKWRLFYTGTSVDLRNTCLADIDGDCELTLFDFLGFQNLFDAGSLEADFDGDGSLTLFDFLAFQNAFSRGCD